MSATRIAVFVAMSGVRIVNDGLRDLGLTRPGFVERGRVIASLPSLGVVTLAAHLPEGWDASLVEIDALDADAVSNVLAQGPDLVVGEGEGAMAEIAARFESGHLRGVLRAPRHRFADGQPVPRYDLLRPDRYNRLTLQTTRGCPLDCSFCAASS